MFFYKLFGAPRSDGHLKELKQERARMQEAAKAFEKISPDDITPENLPRIKAAFDEYNRNVRAAERCIQEKDGPSLFLDNENDLRLAYGTRGDAVIWTGSIVIAGAVAAAGLLSPALPALGILAFMLKLAVDAAIDTKPFSYSKEAMDDIERAYMHIDYEINQLNKDRDRLHDHWVAVWDRIKTVENSPENQIFFEKNRLLSPAFTDASKPAEPKADAAPVSQPSSKARFNYID